MRSRRVILRLAPYVAVFGLIGSTLAWQDVVSQQLGSDVDTTPEVVVAEHTVPTVDAEEPAEKPAAPKAEPSDPPADESDEPSDEPTESSPEPTTGSSAEESTSEPTSSGPVTIAEMAPRPVKAFGLVGVTWASGMPESAEIEVQWHGHDGWSDWTDLHQELAPDEEGRPGTESQWVDWADQVAVRVTNATSAKPVDIQVATVDPGKTTDIAPAAASQPSIILRSQWGAKPHTKCSNSLLGPSTKGAIIHHTVGSNSYSKAESAKIVRATQAYHMNSRGWCDIGYNFLVDKYGQIFEGRAGGISKQVWAAHAGNKAVNEYTVGVSLMGTFTRTAPSSAMKEATAKLVAWRFSLAKLPAKGTYSIGGLTLNRIAAHRNVLSTECPGAVAYAWIGASGGLRDRVASLLGGSGGGSSSKYAITGFKLRALSSSSFRASWNSVKYAKSYQLVYSRSSDLHPHSTISTPSTSRKVSNLRPGTTYYVEVRGMKPNGKAHTSFSTVLKVKTNGAPKPSPTPTSTPSGSTTKVDPPANFKVTERTSTSVKAAWSKVTGAAKYQIQLSTSSSMTDPVTQPSKDLNERFEALTPGKAYYLRVRALKSDGKALTGWSSLKTTTPTS
jgi:hypothetical protein